MYRIVGADQKEYGPVSAEQVRQWIAEGRANGQTLLRFEEGPWKPLATFPEFASALPAIPVSPGAPPPLSSSAPPIGSGAGLPKNNGMATTGLVFGILGLFQCCTPFFALLGLTFSCIGLYQISQNPSQQTGKPLAVAGIVTSVLGLLIFGGLFFSGVLHELSRHLREFRP